MLRVRILLVLLLLGIFAALTAQRSMTATRVHTPIKIDGVLDDAAWTLATPTTDFTQFEPNANTKPTAKSTVSIVYDDSGVYVGAHLYQDPSTILKELTPRDQRANTDWFAVTIDPYQSGINGFAYIVYVTGVQQDVQVSSSGEDVGWNAVWKSKVTLVEDGWVVEMKIPYAAIRFPKKDIQEWNIQLGREIRNNREQMFWNPRNPNIAGFVNQCGTLTGISNIKSPVRLSLTPFVVGYLDHNSANATGEKSNTAFSAGMDLKYGINDAFTLDMTLIPDFGQVVSDNLVVNLGPFEQFFDENRAFFTEGVELFNKGRLFYTRRIGGQPLHAGDVSASLATNEEIESNPSTTPLINATKISGRTTSGVGIGVFNAVVGDQFATIKNTENGNLRELRTNPYTNYNVFVVDKTLPNNSEISMVNTNTLRFGDDYEANVTGVFFNLKDKSQNYGIDGKFVLSQKYFTDETDLGHSYHLRLGKIGGKFRYNALFVTETDDYDPNDLGFLFSPNERTLQLRVEYVEFNPANENLLRWLVFVAPVYEQLYRPSAFVNFAIRGRGFVLFKSRVGVGGGFVVEPLNTNDYFEPRTSDFSRFYKFPKNYAVNAFVSSDYRKSFAYDLRVFYRKFDEDGRYVLRGEFLPRVRFSNKFSLLGNLVVTSIPNQIGYLDQDEVSETISGLSNEDVLFGRRDRTVIDNSIQLNYIFDSNMSLSIRARHYWDNFTYNQFVRLEEDGSLAPLSFDGRDIDGEPYFDRNVNIFNIDLFYTWRFAPGSDIVVAWKNSIFSSDSIFDNGYLSNLSNVFDADQFNSLSLRVIYYLDYNTLRNPKTGPNPSLQSKI